MGNAWKQKVICPPVQLDHSLNGEGYNQPCNPTEEPICSEEVKTEDVDPLDTTEVISEEEGEDVTATNNGRN